MNNNKTIEHLDVLAIGDIVIDAFIRLSDAEVICDAEGRNCKLAVRYGDKVPYDSVEICNAVGNAPNGAVSAARLGCNTALLTYVGGDQNGRDCIEALTKEGIHTDLVTIEQSKKTNYHYVLWYDVDRTILIKHEAFTYSIKQLEEKNIVPKWMYLSSLGEHSLDMYAQIAEYLEKNPEINLAFQPGIFDIKQGKEKLGFIYKKAAAVCVNVEEAQRILSTEDRDLPTLMRGLAELGPKFVFITDGFEGAYGHDSTRDESWFIPIYPHSPVERTGAGDAFFSTVISCFALGLPVHEALLRGPINSMSVVQQVGAQKGLLTREKLEEFLKNAPETYTVKKI
jgi:sugar/nucleoside kinase (ribokinase family)